MRQGTWLGCRLDQCWDAAEWCCCGRAHAFCCFNIPCQKRVVSCEFHACSIKTWNWVIDATGEPAFISKIPRPWHLGKYSMGTCKFYEPVWLSSILLFRSRIGYRWIELSANAVLWWQQHNQPEIVLETAIHLQASIWSYWTDVHREFRIRLIINPLEAGGGKWSCTMYANHNPAALPLRDLFQQPEHAAKGFRNNRRCCSWIRTGTTSNFVDGRLRTT